LETDFNTTLANIQWIITGYSLSLAAVIPLSAWLIDRLGAKWVFIASEVLFVGGSALCGLAGSDTELIFFRVIQGIGGGLLMPVGMTILMRVSPPDTRGRMMAVLGIPMMLGPIAGPLLGGWFVQDFSWRLIFYINLPIGLVGAVLAVLFLRADRPEAGARNPLDVLGLILICPAMVGIVYGLSQPSQYGWGSFQVLGPLIAGGVLLVAFVFVELRQRFPLLDLRVYKDSGYAGAQVLVFLVAATLFGAVFLMPLFLQQVQGMGTLKSGFVLAFQGIAAGLMMPISGILTDRIGARKIVPFGVVVLTAASLWTSTIQYNTSEGVIMLMMAARGIGMGLTMMPAMSAAYVTLRPEQVAAATSLTNVVQRVAAAIGVAVLSTILTNRIVANMPHVPGHSIGGSTASLAALNLPPQIKDILLQQASKGFQATFLIAAGLGVLCLPAALLLQRARSGKEVRDYAVGQLRQGVVLGTAALRVREDGTGRLSPEASEGAFSALTHSAKARINKAALLMRLGSNAGGLVPRPPMSRALKTAVSAAAVIGLACTVAGFLYAFRTPDVPNILPLLSQLQHPGH
ncbi:MAG: DHA2 family efflux MFS transporter permease subunit, partial [Candidatus Dormibacteraeota bacterium]|nr:DHA2 family efflux MFS transporter permease subunit [Candidatus Dormibacteraeota bacterium]